MGPGCINEIFIILSIDGGHNNDLTSQDAASSFSILIMDNNILNGPYAPNSRRLAGCGMPGLLGSDQQLAKEYSTRF